MRLLQYKCCPTVLSIQRLITRPERGTPPVEMVVTKNASWRVGWTEHESFNGSTFGIQFSLALGLKLK